MYCRFSCSLKLSLKVHYLTHSGKKCYKCEICQELFKYRATLKLHMDTHSVTKLFACKHWEKFFAQFRYLKAHLLKHKKIKPHKCDLCQKTFAERVPGKPLKDAHPWKTVSVQPLSKIMAFFGLLGCAHPLAYRRKDIKMQYMRKSGFTIERTRRTHETRSWKEMF